MLGLLFFILAVVITIHIPAFQTWLGRKGSDYISEKTGYPIHIEKIKINWLDQLNIYGLQVDDLQGKKLFEIEVIHADYDLIELIQTKRVRLDHMALVRPDFRVGWYPGEEYISMSKFVKDVRELFIVPNKNKKKKVAPFDITRGEIIDGKFEYFDARKTPSERLNYFDHNFFTFDSINGDVENFRILLDSISFKTIGVRAVHTGSNLDIKSIDTEFLYCNKHLLFDDLEAKIGQTVLRDSISFRYDELSAFGEFNSQVMIEGNLVDCVIEARDLEVFAPQLNIFQDQWRLTGLAKGKVNDFRIKDMRLGFGTGSVLNGSVGFSGLPKMSETLLDLKFENSSITPADIRQYVRSEKFHQHAMRKFGKTTFTGSFRGFTNDFVSNGDFITQIGKVNTDVNFEIDSEKPELTQYSGNIETIDFDLGKFWDTPELGKINMKAKIKEGSRGFNPKNGEIALLGSVSKIEVKKYPYQNIKLDAKLSKGRFIGELSIKDPNLELETKDSYLDFEQGDFTLDMAVKKVFLKPLGFSSERVEIEGDVDLNLHGINKNFLKSGIDLDSLGGTVNLPVAELRINQDTYTLDGFNFSSEEKDGQREFVVNSTFADIAVVGDYKFKTIFTDFPQLVKEYILYFQNDKVKTQQHYLNKGTEIQRYNVAITADLKDVNPLFALIDSNYTISKNTSLKGELKRGESTVFNLYTSPSYFRYKTYEFYDNEIDISSSKLVNSSLAIGSVYLNSKKQVINGNELFDESDLLMNINDDEVYFQLKTNQAGSDNYLFLNGVTDFFSDSLTVALDNSYIYLLNKKWQISDENLISITPKRIDFRDVVFNNVYQLLSLNGVLSKGDEKLNIKLRDFELENLKNYTKIDLQGLASGNLEIQNAYSQPSIKSKLLINDMTIKGDTIGRIQGIMDWSQTTDRLEADVDLIRNEKEVAHITGHYDSKDQKSPLNFDIEVDQVDLGILQPFLDTYVKSLVGTANGLVALSGTVQKPNWEGKLDLKKGGFLFDYFKTYYQFENQLVFDDQSIYMKNIELIDTVWKTKTKLDGSIDHYWFKKYSADIKLKLQKSFLLNTKSKDNSLYYGTAFATGDVQLIGPFNNLKITSSELKSEAGTAIFIPLEEPENLSKKDYIHFITAEEKLGIDQQVANQTFNVSGVEMDINFNLTRDAKFEIIFDAQAGDIIKGEGTGLMNLQIDTRGDFNMFGTYEFSKGTYNFTLIDLINKKFDIEPGGQIAWNGDPYLGELDISATYEQFTNLSNIVKDTTVLKTNPDVLRKVPVEIVLGLTGLLTNPNVDFDINILNYPSSLEASVADFQSQLRNNDQLKNKQVFSLVVFKQLSREDNLGDIGTGTQQNLSELFSNQFSSWVSQFDENLAVDIDLSGFDAESNNVFRLKLEYSLLDGRIRISRDGSFQNIDSGNELANVFGEWTIEYLITQDGKIRMKAFNRNSNIAAVNSANAAINTTYGFSITHNKSFDTLRELFKSNTNVENK